MTESEFRKFVEDIIDVHLNKSLNRIVRQIVREELEELKHRSLPKVAFTVGDVAEMFDVSKKTVQRWHSSGALQSVLITSRDKVSTLEQIQAFLETRAHGRRRTPL